MRFELTRVFGGNLSSPRCIRIRIRFKFVKNSEYLHVGMRFLLREGKTKVGRRYASSRARLRPADSALSRRRWAL